ncbi:NDR1/HIN1-like protein 6 [Coffea eugenioides]|uniref:NDR1/HIN1-like protein 6 n=1 Tax=Coffea arabica TaxID=13443 RepID=A0ABM4U745_COFAR|nr:NDR1/HIN1-like protein 6 [Coffea arabica]XP_027168352.1 NDR1/HIN1-like protein 6 [Coffea eugenioides]
MADRVYPAAKAAANGTTTTAAAVNPTFPPTKGQLYNNTTRPVYRPQSLSKRRHSRSCCCSCCLWTTLFIILILVLVAVAGAVFWVIYRPHRPNFSVSSLQLSHFNLTSTGVNSKFNFTLVARNPNKKIKFFYDPINVSVLSDGVDIGDGSFPSFEHGTKNTTTLKTVISSSGQSLDATQISTLKSDLKNQNGGLPLKVQLNTKVKVKVGGLKTKKVGIKVTCEGIKLAVPTGKAPTTATTSNIQCKVDLRIKIWKWTV